MLHLTLSFIGLVTVCSQLTSSPLTTRLSSLLSSPSFPMAVPSQPPSAWANTSLPCCLPIGVSMVVFQVPSADMCRPLLAMTCGPAHTTRSCSSFYHVTAQYVTGYPRLMTAEALGQELPQGFRHPHASEEARRIASAGL